MSQQTSQRAPSHRNKVGSAKPLVLIVLGCLAIAAAAFFALKPPPEAILKEDKGGPPPALVEPVRSEVIVEQLEALGTARANEIVTLSSKVTELIESIHFQDGQLVEAGALLFQLRDSEQRAELDQARALLSERERQVERVRSVGDSGAVSKSALDEEMTRFDSARAQVALYESRVADRRLEAPFAGKLGLRRVSPGELVAPGNELITLSDLTPIKVDFTAPERYVGRLAAGQTIEARSVAYAGDVFVGKIQSVSPVVDSVSRAAQARAIIANEDQRLYPGMLLRIRIELGQRSALTIPESALAPVGNRQYVFVVDADQIARRREVQIGERRGGRIEIVDGLVADERVITHGFRATDGKPVKVVEDASVFEHGSAEK